jgi:NAD(P)-dependent dehydrogenase (short-subunit alcohol dehydrogenase family)
MYSPELFQNKKILVTGGRSGIGYAIAKQMLQLGAEVMIVSRKEEPLREAARQLSEYGVCHFQVCDIRNSDDVANLAEGIRNKMGSLDILINNAGGQFPALAEYISDKGWNAVINNNLTGTFFMTREMANAFFIPQSKGAIVNIIANVSRGFPGMLHSGAARAGVENMTKTLAQEWSEFNIRINCVAPGIIDSSGLDQYPGEIRNLFDEARKAIPMQRFGSVEEVSNAVCFLASPLSSYTTGTTLFVDGAQHLNFNTMGLADALKKDGEGLKVIFVFTLKYKVY